jgi:hypothetical protein
MWWFFSFWDISILLIVIDKLLDIAKLDVMIARFFLLGLLPGTSFQITFSEIVIILWVVVFALFIRWFYLYVQKYNLAINSNYSLPKNISFYKKFIISIGVWYQTFAVKPKFLQ